MNGFLGVYHYMMKDIFRVFEKMAKKTALHV